MSVDIIYYINLDHREDRKTEFMNWILDSKFNGVVERIPAIYNKTKGYIGCTMSHIKALEMAEGNTLILEDDAVFMPNFLDNFNNFVDNLPSNWDIIYLGAHIGTSEPVNSYMARGLITSSAHAYCINPKRITEMLDVARNTTDHIDVAYAKEHPRMKAYVAQPTLVKQRPGFSDISLKDVDYLSWYK